MPETHEHDQEHDHPTGGREAGERPVSAVQPVILPAFADDPVDPRVDQPIDGVLDGVSYEVLAENGWPYLPPDAPDPGPTTPRSEPAYVRAYAILDGLDRPGGLITPDVRCADLAFAVIELTENGASYPDPFMEFAQATDATTPGDALADAASALNELITNSESLTRTLHLTRARSMVRQVAADFRDAPNPTTNPATRGSSESPATRGEGGAS